VALLTAVLVSELNAAVTSLPGHQALGAEPGLALMRMNLAGNANTAGLAGLSAAVRTAFDIVFYCAAAISAVTFIGSLGLKEIPLRAS
jgi:hypothetical protein